MSILEQVSFTSGEISPSLYARTDLARYQSGVKKLLNFTPMQYGGVRNRAGFRAIPCAYAAWSGNYPTMIPFSRSETENIVIMINYGFFRFIKNGSLITYASKTITNITQANPAVVTSAAHGYSNGDSVLINNVIGMSQVNNRDLIVTNATTNTFELSYIDIDHVIHTVNSIDYDAYLQGGLCYKIYELAHSYDFTHIPYVDYVQSVDLVIMAHESYSPKALRYFSDTNWTFSDFSIKGGAFKKQNSSKTATVYANAAGLGGTTITCADPIFSLENVGQLFRMDVMDFGVPWEVSIAKAVNDIVRSGDHFYISVNSGTTGSLRPSHTYGDASDGTVVWRYIHSGYGIALITGFVNPYNVSYTAQTYIPHGCLVSASTLTTNWAFGAFGGDQGYPKAVNFYQERLVFGGTTAQPETVFTSVVGAYDDFSTSSPVKDDDGLVFTLAGRKLNKIKFIEGIQDLLCFTSAGESLIAGGSNYVLTPSTLSVRPQSNYGTAQVKPILVGDGVIFIHQNGSTIFDMAFNSDSTTSSGIVASDITLLANHLFNGYSITKLAYQQTPDRIIWVVRDDGVLLSCTYLKDQQVIAWAQHNTDGLFKDVCVIQENGRDILYVIVDRDGRASVEFMQSRDISTIYDSFFVDGGYSYNGVNTTAKTMSLSGGMSWDDSETLTLAASSSTFTSDDVGQYVFLYDDDSVVKCVITAYTSTTIVSVISDRSVPYNLRNFPVTTWSFALLEVGGLWSLNGKTVSILANGNVEPQQTVTNGKITLQSASDRFSVGLPYVSDLETLKINVLGSRDGTTQTKQKLINKVSLICQDTRGLFAGADDTHLREYRPPKHTTYDDPLELQSGLFEQAIASSYDKQGAILIRQSDPLPVTILSIIPEVTVGGA